MGGIHEKAEYGTSFIVCCRLRNKFQTLPTLTTSHNGLSIAIKACMITGQDCELRNLEKYEKLRFKVPCSFITVT